MAADDSSTPAPTLYSARYRLVGRPDQLVRAGRMLVPVEHKPRARRLQDSHILQVAAQCLVVEEVYGVRPTHGFVIVAGGMQQRVEFTSALEQRLLHTMAEMRAFLREDAKTGPALGSPEVRHVRVRCVTIAFATGMSPDKYVEEVLSLVERIPPGWVMSYGGIAEYL